MCSVSGGLVSIGDEERICTKDYKCLDCGINFKGFGVIPVCTQCKSKNVKRVK